MAKEVEYLSPISRTPYLRIERDDVVVYRDKSTGQEFDEAYVKANGLRREDLDGPKETEVSEEQYLAKKNGTPESADDSSEDEEEGPVSVSKMTKDQLLEVAEAEGVALEDGAKVPEIRAAITAKREESTEE